jgi:RHS repeat-associated protein
MASDTEASDGNGNQTYDGTQAYTYDAWNRLMTVSHAYRDASGTLQHGQAFDTMAYDARGRRIVKAVNGTGGWDCTYHYYLDRDSVVEEQNGSAEPIKQYVWGLQYIDELVVTSLNSNPTGQTTCDTPYWACDDANANVIGLMNSGGNLIERYEYSPYGQRQVVFSAGANDPSCYAPTSTSRKFVASGTVTEAWGICDSGHQGLIHDEECGLTFSRGRNYCQGSGRWLGRDNLSVYQDGLNLYQYVKDNPVVGVDPYGSDTEAFSQTFTHNWKIVDIADLSGIVASTIMNGPDRTYYTNTRTQNVTVAGKFVWSCEEGHESGDANYSLTGKLTDGWGLSVWKIHLGQTFTASVNKLNFNAWESCGSGKGAGSQYVIDMQLQVLLDTSDVGFGDSSNVSSLGVIPFHKVCPCRCKAKG